MVFRNLILSKDKKYVVFRHLLFWIVYGILFHIQNDNRTLLYISCFLPACIAIVYALLYAVLPLIQNKRYLFALSVGIFTYVGSLLMNFIGSYLFFQTWEGEIPNGWIVGLALHNHILALCMGGVALGLKATKSWYLKQIENLALVKLKAENELMLEKSNLYPEFILQSLTSLQERVVRGSKDSPDLLLKLSDTLSYILYDIQVELIELERELGMVRNIVMFKAMHWPSCNIQFITTGISTSRYVTPLSLFRTIENVLRIVGNELHIPMEIEMKINVEDEYLRLNAVIQYSPDQTKLSAFEGILKNTRKHVEEAYGDCSVDKTTGSGQYSVSVGLPLTKRGAHINDIPAKEDVLA